MKILILSFYYAPDLCAGSFRSTALVEALQKPDFCEHDVEVLTTAPNRYKSYAVEAPGVEQHGNVTIYRINIPDHRSGFVDQSMAFLKYAMKVRRHILDRDYDIVFATSSRLMTAVLGAMVARKKDAFLYLDVRDIFSDTMKDVLPGILSVIGGAFFYALEGWALKQANTVNLVSRGFEEYFRSSYPRLRYSYFTNGIDDEFLKANMEAEMDEGKSRTEHIVLYAGNIGEGQGLHKIVPELAKAMEGRIRFRVIGDGGRKEPLMRALGKLCVKNVEVLDPINREALIQEYKAADILFLHLNDYDAFLKVLPSKIFEYAASGKPIWAGIAGYSAEFVKAEISNASVFKPCDVIDAIAAFERLSLEETRREGFVRKYARSNIALRMAHDIVAVGRLKR